MKGLSLSNTSYRYLEKSFKEWLEVAYSSKEQQENFLLQNHISTEVPLDFNNFDKFIEIRKEKLKEQLFIILNVSKTEEIREGEEIA